MESTVYFRAFEEEDAELIYKWMNDDELKKLSIGVNRRMCRDEAMDWVKARTRDKRDQVWWAICAKVNNHIIGYAYLTDIHYINRSANYGGIVIGDKNYQDGFAWIETYLFVFEYAFERLNLNRLYGTYIAGHPATTIMSDVAFFKTEGLLRQSIFKNGCYNDEVAVSILASEYYEHKNNGEYDIKNMMKRLVSERKKYNNK